MLGLEGRSAIVTGGASGIGRATSIRLVEEGCKVGIFDLNEETAAEAVDACKALGGTVSAYQVDISDRSQVEKAVAEFEAEMGPTELLANVAGWDRLIPFLDTDRDFWDKVIAINLYGPLNMHHVVLPGMADRGFGRIVNIASDAGRVGSSGEAVYSACKGGIIAFTKTMAREMSRAGITLNTVAPGPTDTPLFETIKNESVVGAKLGAALAKAIPMRRLAIPADYPGMIAFLLSDDAAFITGQTISVSGGLTMHG